MDELQLEVTAFTDIAHWRWRLTDMHGAFKADHQVALNQSDPAYDAFKDLYGYLRYHTAPARRLEHEAEVVAEVGRWIGEQVLGPVGTAIVEHAPVTVRVRLPEEAAGLLYRPFELGYVNGAPLAVQDVSFILDATQPPTGGRKTDVGDTLRMLAVFSLPTDASALGLRRERHALKRLITTIAQTQGKAIELRIVQYGVTRETLRTVLEDGEGWDVMHFSGHGLPAGLLLEKPDSTRDPVSVRDLERLLRPARPRLKLVTLSACESAAPTLQETLRWLKLYEPERSEAAPAGAGLMVETTGNVSAEPLPALARTLAISLDCAVLAMRYPVGDDFAIDLAEHLYRGLLEQRRTLPAALQLALPRVLPAHPRPGVPPLSVATPALFGTRAAGLTLTPPAAPSSDFAVAPTGLAYFPPEAEHFVGRVGPMARASAAMAPQSGTTGVLFHGMAGAGKTACALELAYRYDTGRFTAFVWHKAPDAGSDITNALLRLALDMERQLPSFKMVHLVDDADALTAWLPRLTALLEQHSILIVLDNLESLLWPDGCWRDDRWGLTMQALLTHQGMSRTVLTSRYCPAALGDPRRMQIEPIYALSLDEAVLLARELPNLRKLLRGEATAGLERGRELVARTLAVVQGHPKLIELAEGQAGDPEALTQQLERAAAEWTEGEGVLAAFFKEGVSQFTAEDFLRVLVGWTRGVSGALPTAARMLFHSLCALEEEDRLSTVLKAKWGDLWRRLERPGQTPDLAATLASLMAVGLVEAWPLEETEVQYTLHPSVAEAGRAEAGDALQATVDVELAAYWMTGFRHGHREEMRGGGSLIVQAGRSAAPYLIRRRRWEEACALLDRVMARDSSPKTMAGVLPLLRRIAAATEGTERELIVVGVLATALGLAGRWPEAEALLRTLIRQSAERGAFRVAWAGMGNLINLLMVTGRLEEALALTDAQQDYSSRAGLGPWTQLAGEAVRLHLLNDLGRHDEVLAAVDALRGQMRALPETSPQEEGTVPWSVRESILDAGRAVAQSLNRWEEALALNGEIVASQESRGASLLQVARSRFNDYGPLLSLGRHEEVRSLLLVCRAIFEEEQAVADLGRVFSALANLEGQLRCYPQGITFEETALRYKYLAGTPEDCALSHFNLSACLTQAGGPPRAALAHWLAAGIIHFQTASGAWPSTLSVLANHLISVPAEPSSGPDSFDALCRIVEEVEGVRFRDLCERLPHRAATIEEAFAAVLREAMEKARHMGAVAGRPGRGRRRRGPLARSPHP